MWCVFSSRAHVAEMGQAVLVIPCVNDPRASVECLRVQLLSLHIQSHVSDLKKMSFVCYVSAEFLCMYEYMNFQSTCKLCISERFINRNETSLSAQKRGRCSHFTVRETVQRSLILPGATKRYAKSCVLVGSAINQIYKRFL